jgi:hypothetical protein
MIKLVVGVIFGGFVSWLVTHIYYKKSSTKIPDWAKPIIDKLPQSQPTESELLELFQEALNSGDIVPDPIFGHVACPNCKAPASDFEKKEFYEDERCFTFVDITCPHCGWRDHTEL